MGLHRPALLIGASRQTGHEARVVINDGQGMAALAARQRDPALEVHLPHQVRRRLLEALAGPVRRRAQGIDPAMATQDLVHRRDRRRLDALVGQALLDLPRTPGRMSLAHLEHRRLQG